LKDVGIGRNVITPLEEAGDAIVGLIEDTSDAVEFTV